ncbi:MAG: hypothetical protein JOZ46_11830 [Candidatus Dormibacteraeota bacterium]|nr:hypothetical protein [Candidatus Dormibacteraeota bacterium]MBV9526489.1 hypothetical protein [Candidatus Dormibacteraeota bacterium]
MFSKRSDRREKGRRSGRALGLTLLALALSGAVLLAGAHRAAAGPLPPAGSVTDKGTRSGKPPAPTPSPTPAPGNGRGAVLDSSPPQPGASTTAPAATTPAGGGQVHAGPASAPAGSVSAGGAAPAAPLSSGGGQTAAPSLDGVRVPPVEAMSPVSGMSFKGGLEVGPALLVADALGLAALGLLVRRRWLRSSD